MKILFWKFGGVSRSSWNLLKTALSDVQDDEYQVTLERIRKDSVCFEFVLPVSKTMSYRKHDGSIERVEYDSYENSSVMLDFEKSVASISDSYRTASAIRMLLSRLTNFEMWFEPIAIAPVQFVCRYLKGLDNIYVRKIVLDGGEKHKYPKFITQLQLFGAVPFYTLNDLFTCEDQRGINRIEMSYEISGRKSSLVIWKNAKFEISEIDQDVHKAILEGLTNDT